MKIFPHDTTFHGISPHGARVDYSIRRAQIEGPGNAKYSSSWTNAKGCTPTYIYIYINKKQETLGIWPIKTTSSTKQELGRVEPTQWMCQ
jgi:hypothetical protein